MNTNTAPLPCKACRAPATQALHLPSLASPVPLCDAHVLAWGESSECRRFESYRTSESNAEDEDMREAARASQRSAVVDFLTTARLHLANGLAVPPAAAVGHLQVAPAGRVLE